MEILSGSYVKSLFPKGPCEEVAEDCTQVLTGDGHRSEGSHPASSELLSLIDVL